MRLRVVMLLMTGVFVLGGWALMAWALPHPTSWFMVGLAGWSFGVLSLGRLGRRAEQ